MKLKAIITTGDPSVGIPGVRLVADTGLADFSHVDDEKEARRIIKATFACFYSSILNEIVYVRLSDECQSCGAIMDVHTCPVDEAMPGVDDLDDTIDFDHPENNQPSSSIITSHKIFMGLDPSKELPKVSNWYCYKTDIIHSVKGALMDVMHGCEKDESGLRDDSGINKAIPSSKPVTVERLVYWQAKLMGALDKL